MIRRIAFVVCLLASAAFAAQGEWMESVNQVITLSHRGQYGEAAQRLRVLIAQGQRAGEEELHLAWAWNNLGAIEEELGHYVEAERLYRRALEVQERKAPESVACARTLSNLGELYAREHRFGKALPFVQRSVALRARLLPAGDPEMAAGLHALASVYEWNRRYAEAEPLYRQVIAIWERNPENQLRLAKALNNLASTLGSTGRTVEAVPLLERALSIEERLLGPEHPVTADLRANLGALYVDLHRYAESERLLEHALATSRRTLGDDHPQVARILTYTSELMRQTGRKAQAKTLERTANAIMSKRSVEEPGRYSVDAGEILALRSRGK